MARGQIDQQTELQRALAKAQEALGVVIDYPLESDSDMMREGQSVLNYYSTVNSTDWKDKQCKYCGKMFKYCWNSDAIAYCGIVCMKDALKQIGIDWDPSKAPAERWGKYIPAVVPPGAIEILQDQDSDELQEDPLDDILASIE
jgi:hypothetical protein